jgi:hypothetical protein
MTPPAKWLGIAVLTATAAAIVALPIYSSKRLDRELTELASRPGGQSGLALKNLKHEAGFLSSKGSVDVEWRSACGTDEGAATAHIEYTASHLPAFAGPNRFDWQARPTGDSAKDFAKLFGSEAPLVGAGAVTWAGLIRSDMKLPAVSYAHGGEMLELAPSQGTLAIGGQALQFAWQLDRAVVRGSGQAMEFKQVGIDVQLQNRQRGTGTMALNVGTFSNSTVSAEGIKLVSNTTEHGDRLDSVITQGIARLQFANQDLKDLVLEAALKGLHTGSVETLSTVLNSSCGVDNLTRDESIRVRQALKTLLSSGMSFGIPKLSGQSANGGLNGQIMVQLLASTKGDQVNLARQLTSSGELTVKGSVLDAQQRNLAMSTGYVNEIPDGVKASYEYAKGLLKVSGKTLDASGFEHMLADLDKRINDFLKDPAQAIEAPVASAPAAPQLEEEPANEPPARAEVETIEPATPALPAQAPAPAPTAPPAPAHADLASSLA